MELASNLVWVVVSCVILSLTYRGVRRGAVNLSMASAMTMALLACFILLPAISVSDDLLEARQAALPLSSQTWRLAADGLSSGMGGAVFACVCLLLLTFLPFESWLLDEDQWAVRPLAARLARSQRLRPPPFPVY